MTKEFDQLIPKILVKETTLEKCGLRIKALEQENARLRDIIIRNAKQRLESPQSHNYWITQDDIQYSLSLLYESQQTSQNH